MLYNLYSLTIMIGLIFNKLLGFIRVLVGIIIIPLIVIHSLFDPVSLVFMRSFD